MQAVSHRKPSLFSTRLIAVNGFISALTIFDLSPYHYVPTRYVTIIFVVLFGLSTCRHHPLPLSAKGIFMESTFPF